MKITLKTSHLKSILEVVKKGLGSGKILPITEFIEILFVDGAMFVTSTDLTTWVTYKMPYELPLEPEQELSIIVDGNKFHQLISKTNVENVEMELKGDVLLVKGNGVYEFPTLQEEFPDYSFQELYSKDSINVEKLKKAISQNEGSVATDMIMPCLTGYCVGKDITTTNSIKMTISKDVNVCDNNILIPQQVATLIQVLEDDEATISVGEGTILIDTSNITIFGPLLEGIEQYPNLDFIIQKKFEGSVDINIKNMLDILERLKIFSDPLNVNGVILDFKEHFISVYDHSQNNVERLNYVKKHKFIPYTLTVDIRFLEELLKKTSGSVATINYGDSSLIEIVGESVNHYLCLINDGED